MDDPTRSQPARDCLADASNEKHKGVEIVELAVRLVLGWQILNRDATRWRISQADGDEQRR